MQRFCDHTKSINGNYVTFSGATIKKTHHEVGHSHLQPNNQGLKLTQSYNPDRQQSFWIFILRRHFTIKTCLFFSLWQQKDICKRDEQNINMPFAKIMSTTWRQDASWSSTTITHPHQKPLAVATSHFSCSDRKRNWTERQALWIY